jgi:hypothetical protein
LISAVEKINDRGWRLFWRRNAELCSAIVRHVLSVKATAELGSLHVTLLDLDEGGQVQICQSDQTNQQGQELRPH